MVPNNLIDTLARVVRKHAPEILVGLGVTGVVTGTVIACKETQNITPILEEHEEQMNDIREAYEAGEVVDVETKAVAEYTPADYRRDTFNVYLKTGWKLCKLYLPAGLVIGGSIVCILSSHTIMVKRNVGLTAAYAGLNETFNNYRSNIVEKFGETADMEARYGVKAKKVKGKNGEEDSVEYQETDKLKELSENDHSRFFDHESIYWDKNVNMNLMKLHQAETLLNRKLKTRRSHVVTLNEVYDALDLRPSTDGQVLGFKYRPVVDPIDENGIPEVIKFTFVNIVNGNKTKKKVDEVLSTGEINEPVMLIDFPGVEAIV